MSVLGNVFKAVLNATASAVADGAHRGTGSGQIDRLCQEAGWTINERNPAGVVLYFDDPVIRRRKIMVTEGSSLIRISTLSGAALHSSRVPIEVLGYLLMRNANLIMCDWQVYPMGNNGNVSFALAYTALASGLSTVTFKMICETMVKEAGEFDSKMRAVGLLQA